MLSALVFTPTAADAARRSGAVLRTLAALVPAAVEGVVRDVTLLGIGDGAALAGVADEAGCRLVEAHDFGAALAEGVAGARAPWVFVVEAGTAPARAFGEEAARALDGASGDGAALLLRRQPTGLLARCFPALAPAAGVILPGTRLREGRYAGFRDVLRRARPARALPTPAAG